MKVAVTGGTGFIGRHTVAALATAGHDVTVVARHARPVAGAGQVLAGDITTPAIIPLLAGQDTIIHLAGQADASQSTLDPVGYIQTNALGTLNVLEAARQHGAAVVFSSSQRVYEPWQPPLAETTPTVPTTVYGWSKLAAEHWVTMYRQQFGVPTAILRLFSIYGPGQRTTGGLSGVVAIFAERALQGQELIVMQPHLRDFVYVGDLAAALVSATERLKAGQLTTYLYNIGSGTGLSFAALAAEIRQQVGNHAVQIVQRATDEQAEQVIATTDRARDELGWTATTPLQAGIAEYLTWLRTALAEDAHQ